MKNKFKVGEEVVIRYYENAKMFAETVDTDGDLWFDGICYTTMMAEDWAGEVAKIYDRDEEGYTLTDSNGDVIEDYTWPEEALYKP